MTTPRELHDKILSSSSDDGRVIEIGFQAMRRLLISKYAPEAQVEDMRLAFFAGAQHLFASIFAILDPDSEPTDKDMERMSKINDELNEFTKEVAALIAKRS